MGISKDELTRQYRIACEGVGLTERCERGAIEVRGADRAAWLNNLVTNVVKTLGAGEGNYAFAINVKGRIVVDLNILVLDDAARPDGRLWLDVDAAWVEEALKHFKRYIITEDVSLTDRTPALARLGLVGPGVAAIGERIGVGHLGAMASLQHVALDEAQVVRHDFAGVMGAEFVVPAEARAAWEKRLMDAGRSAGIERIAPEVIDTLRIEAGIPASRRDLDGEVTPPETGQIERGISYHKGCYLGQEVVERMRSHGVVPRRLVSVRANDGVALTAPMVLQREGADAGRITSACWSVALGAPLGLGYAKSAHATPGTRLTGVDAAGRAAEVEIVRPPLAGMT